MHKSKELLEIKQLYHEVINKMVSRDETSSEQHLNSGEPCGTNLWAKITLEVRDSRVHHLWEDYTFEIDTINLASIGYAIYPTYRELLQKFDTHPGFYVMLVIEDGDALCEALDAGQLEIEEKLLELLEAIHDDAKKVADKFDEDFGAILEHILNHWTKTMVLTGEISQPNIIKFH